MRIVDEIAWRLSQLGVGGLLGIIAYLLVYSPIVDLVQRVRGDAELRTLWREGVEHQKHVWRRRRLAAEAVVISATCWPIGIGSRVVTECKICGNEIPDDEEAQYRHIAWCVAQQREQHEDTTGEQHV